MSGLLNVGKSSCLFLALKVVAQRSFQMRKSVVLCSGALAGERRQERGLVLLRQISQPPPTPPLLGSGNNRLHQLDDQT